MGRFLSLFDDRVGLIAAGVVALALLLCRPVARRYASRTSVAFLAIVAALFVALVTVANRGIDVSDDGLGRQVFWWARDPGLPRGADLLGWCFNAALFVPVAFFSTLLVRRPVLVAVCLVGASFAVETAQAAFLTGRPDVFDLLANSLGAIAGAAGGRVACSLDRSATDVRYS